MEDTQRFADNLILDTTQPVYVVLLNDVPVCYVMNRDDATTVVKSYGDNELNFLQSSKNEYYTDIHTEESDGSYVISYQDKGWLMNGQVQTVTVAYKKLSLCQNPTPSTPPNERVTVTIDLTGKPNHQALFVQELALALAKRREVLEPIQD